MDIDAQLDHLYDRIDDAMTAGRFGDIDAEIADLDAATTEPVVLIGWLTITAPARDKLPARAPFATAVRKRLEGTMPPEDVEGCMRGLE